jgi:ABC-2 type transport system permease protein
LRKLKGLFVLEYIVSIFGCEKHKMGTVFFKEINGFLSSLVAYIIIGIFLLVMSLFLWVFPESSILEYGYAGLDALFNTAPYIFMFMIPALTMRSLSEERKEGTFELLATRPLTDWQIVSGKFLACLVIVLFALLPTLVYYFTVSELGVNAGNIDTGAVIGSYIGLFLLGGAFVAMGIFASSVTKNQIIAFAIGVFLCFFIFAAFDSLSQLLSLQHVDAFISSLGINEHYQSISRGVLDTRDLIYFLSVIGVFLVLTKTVLGGRKW